MKRPGQQKPHKRFGKRNDLSPAQHITVRHIPWWAAVRARSPEHYMCFTSVRRTGRVRLLVILGGKHMVISRARKAFLLIASAAVVSCLGAATLATGVQAAPQAATATGFAADMPLAVEGLNYPGADRIY